MLGCTATRRKAQVRPTQMSHTHGMMGDLLREVTMRTTQARWFFLQSRQSLWLLKVADFSEITTISETSEGCPPSSIEDSSHPRNARHVLHGLRPRGWRWSSSCWVGETVV